MPLKFKINSLEGVEEATKALYKQEGEGYVLDVEGLPPQEDVSGLKSALQKERENVEERDKTIKAFKKIGDTPDAITTKIKELEGKRGDPTEQEKMIQQMKEQQEAMKEQFSTKEAELQKQRDDAIQKANNSIIGTQLTSALAKAGFTKTGMDIIPQLNMNRIRFVDRDGNQVPEVLTKDLKAPMIGTGEGSRATFDDLAKELANDYPELVSSERKGGGGTPPGSGGPGSEKTVTREHFDKLSPVQQMKAIEDGMSITD